MQVSFASFPRRLARTCTSALHVSSVPNLVWMPMPSRIGCRHGSRVSLRIPVLSRYALFYHHPFGNSSCQSARSASAELKLTDCCVLDQTERVVLSHCVNPPRVLWYVWRCLAQSVCAHVHERRESVDLDQSLCDRDTLQVSHDALHVHLVALSGAHDLSCCSLHAVHCVSTLLAHVQQLSHGCSVHGSLLSPARPATLSLASSSRSESNTGLESSRPSTAITTRMYFGFSEYPRAVLSITLPRKKILSPSFSIRPMIHIKICFDKSSTNCKTSILGPNNRPSST